MKLTSSRTIYLRPDEYVAYVLANGRGNTTYVTGHFKPQSELGPFCSYEFTVYRYALIVQIF